MLETLEQRTKEMLREYLREVKSLPNEAAKVLCSLLARPDLRPSCPLSCGDLLTGGG